MVAITTYLEVDVARENLFPKLQAKQGDTGSRYLRVQLLNERLPFAVNASAVVSINAKKLDGSRDRFDGTVNEDGTVTVPLDEWMLEEEGTVICDVTVSESDENRLTTMTFCIEVQGACYAGDEISQED